MVIAYLYAPVCRKRDNKTIVYAHSPKTDPALWPMVLEKAIAVFQWREIHHANMTPTAIAKDNVYDHIDAKLPESKLNKCCQVFVPKTSGCMIVLGVG